MASKPEQEPSIEEILASIRQIISDDDQPREAALDLTQEAEEKADFSVVQPAKEEKPSSSFADVLELTNEIRDEDEENDMADEDDMIFDQSVPETPINDAREPVIEEVKEVPQKEMPPQPATESGTKDSLFTQTAAQATSAAFSKLMGNVPVEREENKTLYADGRVTLEDITKDLLRPMLREWINANVPAMVERLVEKELEKLARQARED